MFSKVLFFFCQRRAGLASQQTIDFLNNSQRVVKTQKLHQAIENLKINQNGFINHLFRPPKIPQSKYVGSFSWSNIHRMKNYVHHSYNRDLNVIMSLQQNGCIMDLLHESTDQWVENEPTK